MEWSEIEKSVKDSRKTQSGGGRRLFMADGDSADLRFFAPKGEPYIYKQHFDATTRKYIVCAEDAAKAGEHDGCVACSIARTLRGPKARLKSPQRKYAASVFDPRKYHFVEANAKGKQYQPCTDDDSCRWCRRGVDRKINGVRHWSMAEQVILQLKKFVGDTLGKRCRRCENGRIKVMGYQCPTCESELEPDDPAEEVRCIACEKEQGKKPVLVKAKEIISCKNCGPKGKRMTLSDAWVTVSKSGELQNTTWNFTLGEVEPFDPDTFIQEFPDLKKIVPIDFAHNEEFQPLSAREQALILGVDVGAKDDDDEEEENIFTKARKKNIAPDDDDDVPRKKKRVVVDDDEDEAPKKKRRPVDDEEDESIFD